MIDIKPPVSQQGFRRSPEDIDALLRAFMQAEMPKPWPAMQALPPPPVAPSRARRWLQPGSRFALAASLAAFLVGSLTLTSLFPTQAPPSKDQGDFMPHIASDPTDEVRGIKPSRDVSPDGRNVKVWEVDKGNTKYIKVELVP